eukprot:77871_1
MNLSTKFINNDQCFQYIFTNLLIYDKSSKSYQIHRNKIDINLMQLRKIIYNQYSVNQKINNSVLKLYDSSQKYMNKLFHKYFAEIPDESDDEFYKRIIFWQKKYFEYLVKHEKKPTHISIQSVYNIMQKVSIEPPINDAFFIQLNMIGNGNNFLLSLQQLYGEHERKLLYQSFVKKLLLLEKTCNNRKFKNLGLNWIIRIFTQQSQQYLQS